MRIICFLSYCLVCLTLLIAQGKAIAFDFEQVRIHGFASTGYIKTTDNNFLLDTEDGSFEFNEAAVNFSTSPLDKMNVGLQLYTYDLGNRGNNEAELDWAFLDYRWKNELGIRIGKIKTPFGLYNEIRDYDMLRTSLLLPQGCYYKYFREATVSYQGGGLYGNIDISDGGMLKYDLIFGTTSMEDDGTSEKDIAYENYDLVFMDFDYVWGGRLQWLTPLEGLLLSGTLIRCNVNFKEQSLEMPVSIYAEVPEFDLSYLSCKYTFKDFTLSAEYHRMKGDITTYPDLSGLGIMNAPIEKSERDNESWYVMVSYRFCDWFEAGAYYCEYYPDENDKDGDKLVEQGKADYHAWQMDTAFSMRFDITDFWLFKAEIHFMDGTGLCSWMDNPNGYDRNWELYSCKTTFSF